jgi:hypothetical protein
MMVLQPVQHASPGVSPVRAPVAVETVTAVQGAAGADRARNDGARDRGAEAERLAREAKDRAADPATPVGPPPAFQANVLEAERARLRKAGADKAGPAAGASEPEPVGQPVAATNPRTAPPTYGTAAEPVPAHRIDVTR